MLKKEWLLVSTSVIASLILAIGLVRWLAPQLLGIPVDLQLVKTSQQVPPFYDNVFREEDYETEKYIINDPNTIIRAKPLLADTGWRGPNDILGFRNLYIPNQADIVITGDSQTYSDNVAIEKSWPYLLKNKLAGKHQENFEKLRMMAEHMMRPYSRKYDREEHSYPKEMEEVAKLLGSERPVAGAKSDSGEGGVRNGANLMTVTAYEAMCWGDVGLFLGMPGSGLGNTRFDVRGRLVTHIVADALPAVADATLNIDGGEYLVRSAPRCGRAVVPGNHHELSEDCTRNACY